MRLLWPIPLWGIHKCRGWELTKSPNYYIKLVLFYKCTLSDGQGGRQNAQKPQGYPKTTWTCQMATSDTT